VDFAVQQIARVLFFLSKTTAPTEYTLSAFSLAIHRPTFHFYGEIQHQAAPHIATNQKNSPA